MGAVKRGKEFLPVGAKHDFRDAGRGDVHHLQVKKIISVRTDPETPQTSGSSPSMEGMIAIVYNVRILQQPSERTAPVQGMNCREVHSRRK